MFPGNLDMSLTFGVTHVHRVDNHIKNGGITTILDFEITFSCTITDSIPATTLVFAVAFI